MKDMNDKINEFKSDLIEIEEAMHELIVQNAEFTREFNDLEERQIVILELLENEGIEV